MEFELAVFAALGAMLFWGVGDFLIQRSVRRIGDVETLALIGLFSSIFLLPFVIADLKNFGLGNVIFFAAFGVFTFFLSLANLEALKKGKLSVIEVVLEIELPITIVLGMFIFGEYFSFVQFLLMLAVFAGVALVAFSSRQVKKYHLEKGVLLAIITGAGMGLLDFLTASASRSFSPFMAIWAPWLIFTILCFVVIVKREGVGKLTSNVRRWPYLILSTAIIDTLAWVLYSVALASKELAITTAITESYPAIALLLGLWLNREQIKKHQYLGAGLALAGSIALAVIS